MLGSVSVGVMVCVLYFHSCTQEQIFEVSTKDIVESVLDGYNGSIIASGQTGGCGGWVWWWVWPGEAATCHLEFID